MSCGQKYIWGERAHVSRESALELGDTPQDRITVLAQNDPSGKTTGQGAIGPAVPLCMPR